MELSGKLPVGAWRDTGFVSPPGCPCQHQEQQQSLQETFFPMDVMIQIRMQECAGIS